MAYGYIIVQVDVRDAAKFEDYRQLVPDTIKKHGGEYLVRGGRFERLEGADPLGRIVLLRFPSYEQAKSWYESDDYAGPKAMRHAASSANAILVEGVE